MSEAENTVRTDNNQANWVPTETNPTQSPLNDEEGNNNLIKVEYLLLSLGVFTIFLSPIVAVILAHIKIDDVRGTYLETHQRNIIRTFWYSILWTVIGFVTWFFVVGIVILIINQIWILYRCIKGFIYLMDKKSIF